MKHDVTQDDRRKRKSRQSLRAGLFSLLQQMPYEQITIQAIADAADTARVTFYRHYGAKEELLLDVVNQIQQQLQARDAAINLTFEDLLDFRKDPPTLFGFTIIDSDRFVSSNLFSSPAQNHIRQAMHRTNVEQVLAALNRSPAYADLPHQFIANHIATVNMGYTVWWIMAGFPVDAMNMARLAHYSGMCGAMKMIGRDDLITMPDPESWRPDFLSTHP